MAWDIDSIRRAFAVFDDFSGPCSDELWWRTDGEYAPITLLVNCNDLFVWACSDCVRLTPESLPRLEATKAECLALGDDCGTSAAILWCARERRTRPQRPYYEYIPEIMHPLFDAAPDFAPPLRRGEREVSAPLDCQACGACCVEAGAVSVVPDDLTPRGLTHSVRGRMGFASSEAEDGIRCMRKEIGGRCVALRGEIGTSVRCSTYARRPEVCRTFALGEPGCLAARERMAWKLSRMEWKPHGYAPTTPVAPNLAQGGES